MLTKIERKGPTMSNTTATNSNGTAPAICNFAGKPNGCAVATVATKLVQVGSPDKPTHLAYLNCCTNCANKLDTAARAIAADKREGKNDLLTVPPVAIYNLYKHDFFANAVSKDGAGLVVRGDDDHPQCSVTIWDGTPCAESVAGNGVAFNGVVYPLCHSCEMCARMVYARARLASKPKASLISPIKLELAKVRAQRQLEEIDRARREKRRREDAKVTAPAVKALSIYEEVLYGLTTSPPPKPTAKAANS